MILKSLFTSQARVKLLTLFLLNPEEEFFIRELTRRLEEQINSIRRELDNLKKVGLLKSRVKNRHKYYVVNPKFPLFHELRSIIIKTTDQNQHITDAIRKMGEVDFVLLSGHFIKKQKEIDLLVVGNVNKEELAAYLERESGAEQPVRFTVLSREDFLYRIKCNDRFVKEVVTDPDNLIGYNALENALA